MPLFLLFLSLFCTYSICQNILYFVCWTHHFSTIYMHCILVSHPLWCTKCFTWSLLREEDLRGMCSLSAILFFFYTCSTTYVHGPLHTVHYWVSHFSVQLPRETLAAPLFYIKLSNSSLERREERKFNDTNWQHTLVNKLIEQTLDPEFYTRTTRCGP